MSVPRVGARDSAAISVAEFCVSAARPSPYKRNVASDTGDMYLPRKIDARRIKPVIKITGRQGGNLRS